MAITDLLFLNLPIIIPDVFLLFSIYSLCFSLLSQAELATAKHHAELMAQVEQLNLLTESNRLMRQERITVENELRESKEKLHSLECVVDPLKEELEAVRTDKANLETAQVSLREELECWKKRCTRLIERQEKLDPEVFKKAW